MKTGGVFIPECNETCPEKCLQNWEICKGNQVAFFTPTTIAGLSQPYCGRY